jgi:hypothetical protein
MNVLIQEAAKVRYVNHGLALREDRMFVTNHGMRE